jgi:hypothetical protein
MLFDIGGPLLHIEEIVVSLEWVRPIRERSGAVDYERFAVERNRLPTVRANRHLGNEKSPVDVASVSPTHQNENRTGL